ncbi:MAG TPA: DNA replication and repair protein RecF [Candidatus Sphingobacterium stercorigallinarum]|nr:DNA replication and repair protein RecF [Candidatus Sphingobacterium stercorigallinarum]
MWLKYLNVLNFKNYADSRLEFSPHANAFTGPNGAGKTNLLDAIHYLSLCKSYFNPIDSQQIKNGEDWFMVQGDFEKQDSSYLISCSLKRNQKKQLKNNKKEYDRLADHIGRFPLVMISPNDSVLIMGGSEERRKFVDNVISQTEPLYLDQLITYNRILLQRNTVLKNVRQHGVFDQGLIDVLNIQLVEVGQSIYARRTQFVEEFLSEFRYFYQFLTQGAEQVRLVYESPLQAGDFQELLVQNIDRDRALERTTVGIHKDDLLFTIHDQLPLKKFGSQGQQKSFLVALKLAQYTFLKNKKQFNPLLLLDDIFDKLDDQRTKRLMELVSEDAFGQLFITDTNRPRLEKIFSEIGQPIRIFEIERGQVYGEV